MLYLTAGFPPCLGGGTLTGAPARCCGNIILTRARARPEAAPRPGDPARASATWSDGKDKRIIYVTPGYRMIALDAATSFTACPASARMARST